MKKCDSILFISQAMESQRSVARLSFKQLIVEDPTTGDSYFEQYGPGWKTDSRGLSVSPFECFHDYELLLLILREDDNKKYRDIHKGTPFYFLGLLAFETRNYEAAIFYMNAAFVEDKRKNTSDIISCLDQPAALFLQLQIKNQTGVHITIILDTAVKNAIYLLRQCDQSGTLTPESFVKNFVRPMIAGDDVAILSSLYAYLLESNDIYNSLQITSPCQSTDPLILNLFKGGLIFESILKHYYKKSNGKNYQQLGDINKNKDFINDFPEAKLGVGAKSLKDIISKAKTFDYKTVFATASKLRNATGHNLSCELNTFNSPSHYLSLVNQEKLAVMYVIQKQVAKASLSI